MHAAPSDKTFSMKQKYKGARYGRLLSLPTHVYNKARETHNGHNH